ncbi:DUF4249 domain-containing protein [Larkinella insperata]|uniref:DUF4249 domain-containing protein n=1 Tax=Larkinella insperata TaxID=332158 RepID=A0ABW3QNV9_9BACT|nr:DUF4249 domain-containing protein [Larkinella insperata]
MFLRSLFLCVLTAFGITACQNLVTEVDPSNLPQMDRKLVVNGYLSPQDTVLAVSVSSSQTVLGEVVSDSVNAVRDATVQLSSEGKTVTLTFDPQQRVYTADARQFPIQTGKIYTLRVGAPGFASVTSSCTVPKAVPISDVKIDSTRTYSSPGSDPIWTYQFRAMWQDPAGEPNYYRVAGYGECLNWPPRFPSAHIDTSEAKIVMRGIIAFGRQEQFVADQNQDGQLLTSARGELPQFFDFSFYDSAEQKNYSGEHPFSRPLTIRVSVLQTDENYYRYHRARQQQRQSQNNPFAEPILMPSNIQGGLGCFAAYNRSTTELRL